MRVNFGKKTSTGLGGPQARTGFTLVELLAVITIIAILISILLPSLAKAKHAALRVQCAANLRSLGQGCRLYANDHFGMEPPGNTQTPLAGGKWPFGDLAGWPTNQSGTNAYAPWGFGLLYTTGLITNPTLLYCPEGSYFTPVENPEYYIGDLGQPNGPPNYNYVYTGYCYYYHTPVGLDFGGRFAEGNAVINPGTGENQPAFQSVPESFAQSATSPGDTILASDLATSTNGGQWQEFSNHYNGGNHDVTGGNVLYNDDHVVWKSASQLRCRLYCYYNYFWQ